MLTIREEFTSFMSDNGDGTLSITIAIPATEQISIAKHEFVLRNNEVPYASHLARYMDGKGCIYNPANSALKTWRDSDPNRDKDSRWERDDSEAFLTAYLNGTLGSVTADPVAVETRKLALAHIFKVVGVKTAAEAWAKPKASKFFKESTSEKTGKPVYTVRADVLGEFVTTYDEAQTLAGKPELGFAARARAIVAQRDEPGAVEVDL